MKAEDKGTKQKIKFKAKPEDADRCIWRFEDGDGMERWKMDGNGGDRRL